MAMTLQQMVDEVRAAMEGKLRVRGPSLMAQIAKAGRLLPRRVRSDASYLAQAAALAQNPKLARTVDMARAKQAHRRVLGFLSGIDLGAQRRTAALNMIASIAFALLVTGAVVLFVLVQRGFV
ncbi:hypothetical protein [Loktanella sp. Alg231-35]|uniref:hypothetical protein n=1 Tax=Loktanella sp. Alg231-35 TaxID=1922220 RepID=UPI000D561C5D|nr:hypothetical protein [Loktanella sp. Alg231-35]